ncbi:MAG: hypothetical protein HQL83_11290 [Magnetococcales bacterium]|nr:hypothetical protein [Magnetococcales bacterium]MBF0630990.1 hypothetical protein [Magnetococcales bacterium]
MFRSIKNLVWVFDAEWIPDPQAGRTLYGLASDLDDRSVMQEMWRRNGATEEDPTPYLKTVMCRLVSIAMVQRQSHRDGRVQLRLLTLPKTEVGRITDVGERNLVETFLGALGDRQPQLVGFNSLGADLRILVQRGIIHGLHLPNFARRPNKPWEGVDYFVKGGEWHVDLKDHAAPGWGPGTPSLHELAVLSGIPGKMETHGQDVPQLWLEGKLDAIIAYNEFDALTTYLIWLRMCHLIGLFDQTQYDEEQERVRALIREEASGKPHLLNYLSEWNRLSQQGDRVGRA